jgi:hypothetical protein
MTFGDCEHRRLVNQMLELDSVCRLGREADRHVQLASREPSGEGPGGILQRPDVDIRHPLPELGQQRAGDVVHARREAQAELSALAVREGGADLVHDGRCFDGRARVRQHLPTRFGELHVVAGALEGLDPQLQLEPLDLLAQRRLRDAQPLSRAAEVELIRQDHK